MSTKLELGKENCVVLFQIIMALFTFFESSFPSISWFDFLIKHHNFGSKKQFKPSLEGYITLGK